MLAAGAEVLAEGVVVDAPPQLVSASVISAAMVTARTVGPERLTVRSLGAEIPTA